MTRVRSMIFFASVLSLLLAGCATSGPIPLWSGYFWRGKSKLAGVTVTRDDGVQETIRADDPRFDTFVALPAKDFDTFMGQYLYSCESWRPGTDYMPADQALKRFQVLIEDWQASAKPAGWGEALPAFGGAK